MRYHPGHRGYFHPSPKEENSIAAFFSRFVSIPRFEYIPSPVIFRIVPTPGVSSGLQTAFVELCRGMHHIEQINIKISTMELSISGKVMDVLQEMSGEGRNGPWRKRDFILETQGNYPKQICMTQWGDQIDASPVQKGEMIKASIDIQSREYNGRWYTDVKAWRVEKESGSAAEDEPGGQAQPGAGFPDDSPADGNPSGQPANDPQSAKNSGGNSLNINEDIDDDLPF